MQGKARSAKVLAGALAVSLVAMGIPLVALGLGEDADVLNGTLEARIASPAPGSAFSRLDQVAFEAGTVATLCPVVSQAWEFGDQEVATGPTATHQYGSLGTYEATLVVVGACGRAATASVIFEVVNLPPVAGLLVAPATAAPGQSLTLDGGPSADPDGSVSSYQFIVDGVAQETQGAPTLLRDFVAAGQHVVGLRVVDNEGGVSPLTQAVVDISPGPLATLGLSPDLATLPAGGSAQFEAAGADAFGNPVSIAPEWSSTCGAVDSSGFFAAPTSTGPCAVHAAQAGIEASEAFAIVAGPLGSITVTGPASVVAGQQASYALAGADAFGNPVALAQPSLDYQAPTAVGAEQLCYTESGISGCAAIAVVADALQAIVVTGPAELVAGNAGTYAVSGFDQYGNPVALAVGAFEHTAPTATGPDAACYAEQGIEGCASLGVLPDALASISVFGPASLQAGSHAVYLLNGFDQYGNGVALAEPFLDYAAPTLAGPAQACYAEQGIQDCLDLVVYAGPVSAIAVTGPAALVAGETAAYAISATDEYGNPVALAQSSLDYTAPTLAGAAQVCYTEGDATGCAAIDVVHAALASILVTGPDSLVAGTTGAYDLSGLDAYGNAVPLAQASLDYTAPVLAGAAQACYQESGIAGCHGLEVLAGALATIGVTGPATLPAGSAADFSLAGFDPYGNPVALLVAAVHYTAPASPGPVQVCYLEQGIEGCASVDITPAALAAITVTGPASLVAGSSAAYDLAGFDAFGNPVTLLEASIAYTAPTVAGPELACYQEQGVQGCASIEVLPAALDSISITGPAAVVAGQGAAYALAGRDAYGNAVALAQNSLAYTAATVAGPDMVCYDESGVSACLPISIVPDALASIVVSGPASMVVGSAADFDLGGFDQYGNAVALAQSTLAHTAPTVAGPGEVCHDEAGISGCAALVYAADTLDNIAVSGPASVVAGQSAVYALAGSDAHGNPVALAQSTLDWTAPLAAGPQQVCYAGGGIEGCQAVDVLADALFTIDVSGPDQLVVGESATYALAGLDQYGNPVALDQPSLDFTAPTVPGSASACYEQDGASGCHLVTVVHGPLASIVVTGPDSVVAGQGATFDLSGFDAYGNAVSLAASSLAVTAPTGAGSAQACHEEQGIAGCKAYEVLPDALAAIAVSGPASVEAGSAATFSVAGSDQYGNAVALASSAFGWTAPTLAGPVQACYEESGITGCADVSVVHGPLAAIAVSGPASMAAGSVAAFAVSGADAFGNAVAMAVGSFDYTAPGAVGPAQACYEEQGVQGCADVGILAGPLARIVVSPGDARTNVNQGKDIQFSAVGEDAFGNTVPLGAVAWSADKGAIGAGSGLYKAITAGSATVTATSGGVSGSAPVQVLNTLAMDIVTNYASYTMGSSVRGHALVQFADGDAVKSAKVTLSFVGLSPTGMMCGGSFEGLTNAGGIIGFQMPGDCARLIGDYRIDGASLWKANRGAASQVYHITL